MAHFFDRFIIDLFVEAHIAPVFAYGSMQEILVNGGDFTLEHLVQQLNYLRQPFHLEIPLGYALSSSKHRKPLLRRQRLTGHTCKISFRGDATAGISYSQGFRVGGRKFWWQPAT